MTALFKTLDRSLLALFALLYGWIWTITVFFNSSFQYRAPVQLVLIAAWGCALAVVLALWRRCGDWIRRHKYRAALALLGGLFLVQLVVGLQTVPNPMYDHGKVFWGASHYAQYGAAGEDWAVYDQYLHHYSNNVGLFLVLQFVFRASHWLGLYADYTVAAIGGHLLFFVALWLTFLYLDEAFDTDTAFFSLLLAVLYLPVWFQSTVSYTDTWSVWGIPCLLVLSLRCEKAPTLRGRLLWGGLCGALLGLAAQIKVTVLITAVALLAVWLLRSKLKRLLPAVAAAALAFAVVTAGFTQWKYATVLDHARDHEALPTTHWLMMGLQEDGSYSWIDEWLITGSAPGKEARTQLNLQVIRERLEEMGPTGYLQLLGRKTCRSFGSGNADLRYSLLYADDSQPINLVYDLVLENGRCYGLYNNLSHSFYLTMLLLAVAAAVLGLRRGDGRTGVLCLALVGFWLFMMLWESNHRQWINQWPLLFMLAAAGLRQLADLRLPRRDATARTAGQAGGRRAA